MFGKKCPACSRKISRDFDFCPYCGKSVNSESYGLLGKDDSMTQAPAKDPFESMLNSSMFSKMFSSTVKMLEKELAKEMGSFKKEASMPRSQFELYINGKKVDLGNNSSKAAAQETAKRIPSPSQEILQKAVKLPRKEAETELKRLGNKITYELKVPGINSLDRILVTKLEDSIEVKAFADNCVYIKAIPVKLVLTRYYLKNESLFLEFQGK